MTGLELQDARRGLGLTQQQLAQLVGVTPETIARWERDGVPIRDQAFVIGRLVQIREERDDDEG